MGARNDLTDVPGFRVGSAEDVEALTGCTVVLCPEGGAAGGVDLRGGATGTREIDPLRASHLVDRCHAVVLTGGSAFGLDSASGVSRYLEERGVGFPTRFAPVPIVPAAVIYDLGVGRSDVRPDAAMGFAACQEAERGDPVRLGNAGAGCGATVGKVEGPSGAMKGGLGSASLEALPGLWVGALVAVNAFGDVYDGVGGPILAGARVPGSDPAAPVFVDTVEALRSRGGVAPSYAEPSNTVVGVIATHAALDKAGAAALARMASAGLARVIRPVHTQVDGDVVFALAAGERECDVNLLGAVAAEALQLAVIRAVLHAAPVAGIPCASDLAAQPDAFRKRRETPDEA